MDIRKSELYRLGGEKLKNKKVTVKLDEDEYALLKDASKITGHSVSKYAASAIVAKATRLKNKDLRENHIKV